MAQLTLWSQFTWSGLADGYEMQPNESHYWSIPGGGLQSGDVPSIMSHPVLIPFTDEQILQVYDVWADLTPDGVRSIFFSVRNVGSETVASYNTTTMLLRP
jgi:hypothetical protein